MYIWLIKFHQKKNLSSNFYSDDSLINNLLVIIEKFLKIHIKNQVEAGANIIQIFDSWAGLLEYKIPEYIYNPTLRIVEYTKELGASVICFPRGINIPVQGGLDPKVLLTNKDVLKKEVEKYLTIFKDHPYVFNLGHGILPETEINLVNELVNIVRNFKWILL